MILEFIDHEYNYISKDHTASIYKTTLLLEVEGNLKYLQHLDLYSKQFLPILLYSAVDQGVSHRMPKSSSPSSNTATTPSRNLVEKSTYSPGWNSTPTSSKPQPMYYKMVPMKEETLEERHMQKLKLQRHHAKKQTYWSPS